MIYRLDSLTESSINPITNQPFDDSWIIWQLTASREYKQMVGSFKGCAYTIKYSRYTMDGKCRFAILLSLTRNKTKI